MPEQYQPQVDPQVEQVPDVPMAVTPEVMGGGAAEGLGAVGDAASELWRRAKGRADQASALDADNQTTAFLQERLYDSKTGILNQNLDAKSASEAAQKTLGDYEQHVSRVASGLTNPEQRLMFARIADSKRFELEHTVGRWEHEQHARFEDAAHEQAIANTTTSAVQYAKDLASPDPMAREAAHGLIAEQMAKQQALIVDQNRAKGLPADFGVKQAMSATNMSVLDQLLSSGQDQAGKAWYDAHRDEFDAKDLPLATAKVQAGAVSGEAFRNADRLTFTADGALRPELETDAEIAKIEDPKLRAETQTRADQARAHYEKGVNEQETARYNQAYALITNPDNPQGIYDPQVVQLMVGMPPHLVDSLHASALRTAKDPAKFNELSALAATDPDAFLKATQDPKLQGILGREDYAKIQTMQGEITKTGTISGAAGIRTRSDAIDTSLVAGGFGKPNKSSGLTQIDRESPAAKAFIGALDDRIKVQEQIHKRALSPDEIIKIGDEIAIQHAVQPAGSVYGLNPAQPVFALTPEQRDTASRDFAAFNAQNPQQGKVELDDMRAHAETINGIDAGNRLTPDQLSRAYAQRIIGQELAAVGDKTGVARAKARYLAILGENKPPRTRKPTSEEISAMPYNRPDG